MAEAAMVMATIKLVARNGVIDLRDFLPTHSMAIKASKMTSL